MKKFIEFVRERDRVFAESLEMSDVKAKVYDAIKAKHPDDRESSPDDVWNQTLDIFDDKDEILKVPELTRAINSHPDRGAILRAIDTGGVTVGELVKMIAGGKKKETPQSPPPELKQSYPALPAQGEMEPGHNPVPIA